MSPTKSNAHVKQLEASVFVAPGRVIFREVIPIRAEAKSKGGVILPEKSASGEYGCKQIIYGRITAAGKFANRSTMETLPDDQQFIYADNGEMLPWCMLAGCWAEFAKTNDWKVSPHENALNSWDLIRVYTQKPVWAPEE